MPSSLVINVRPHWISSAFLRVFAKPFVSVDGVEHRAQWGVPWKSVVEAGDHVVSAGVRYRGSESLMGQSPTTFIVGENHETTLIARNGLLNHTPFSITKILENKPYNDSTS
ncbi:hypothetical protein [Glutamicibacter nicotianae]|uniref:hypothetical protein n=1 Tax=Glutamicibacter nicotianae TaxID=37929 RepID=UPI0019595347|nr:hypothetical protein [Glutamicibacter nicotianae]MBM7767724.1 hypothetical protein [Glutamicibacter nicotianae]